MGQEQSIIPIERAVSETCPPCECYVTASLEDICDYDRLWLELSAGLRTDFAKEPHLKSGEVEEVSKDSFKIRKIYDSAALKIEGGPDIEIRIQYTMDKERGEIYEEYRESRLNTMNDIRVTRILRNPLRMEAWNQRINNFQRRAGPLVALFVAGFLKSILKRDVVVEPNQPSKVIPGMGIFSAISEPVDKDIKFGDLWDGIMEAFRTQSINPFAKKVEAGEPIVRGSSITFTVEAVLDGEKMFEAKMATDAADKRMLYRFEGNKEMRVFSVLSSYADTRFMVDVSYTAIHGDPLPMCVEAWMHSADPPGADEIQRSVLSGYVAILANRVGYTP